jgi:uncharacterized protein DUF4232
MPRVPLAVSGALAVALLTASCNGTPAAIRATPPPSGQASVSPSPSPANQSATPSSSASATASASPLVQFASRCTASQLTLAWGGRFSEPTGQHTLPLTLTNSSHVGCHLLGYPGVSFVDQAGRVLPLQYVWGGDQVVTSSKAVMVELPSGGTAYVVVNKYRCDTTDLMQGAAVRIIPPDDRAFLQVSIMDNVSMDYCGPGDPGSVVYVSPVEPTSDAAVAGH